MTVISLAQYQQKSRWAFFKTRWFIASAIAFVIIVILLIFFLVLPLLSLKNNFDTLYSSIEKAKAYQKSKDFVGISTEVPIIQANIVSMKKNLSTLAYLSIVPIAGGYYNNASDLLNGGYYAVAGLQTLMPSLSTVATLDGYQTSTQKSAQVLLGKQKIAAFVHSLPQLGPALDKADPYFTKANTYIQEINPKYFPESLLKSHGITVSSLKSIFSGISQNLPIFDKSVNIIENVLGVPTPTKYLLMFQNSGEIRPTGGFMTAFGFINFNNGNLGQLSAQNIYALSTVVNYNPIAPKPLYVYNGTYHWHLRDANTSPNVPTSVANIYKFYNSIPRAPKINGVIFINTWFVDSMIQAVGNITMPSLYGNNLVLTANNANYYMEYMAEKSNLPQNERKDFISVMMHELITKVFHSTGNTLTNVIKVGFQSLDQKQVLLYFNNPKAENLVNHYNWGGIIPTKVKGDYLQVVEANLAGAKDNYFMGETVTSNIKKASNGRYEQSVSITWTNSAIYDNWLVGPYMAWVRIYVPLGSTLISMKGVNGFTQNYNNYTVSKTVFGNHIRIPPRLSKSDPPAVGTMTVTYYLPSGINMTHYLIQKQPGIKGEWEKINFGTFTKSFYITKDLSINM